jgi:hypothetical protein
MVVVVVVVLFLLGIFFKIFFSCSVEDDGDVEAEEAGRDMEAYERAYADDRSWEDLQEDESGRLRVVDVAQQQRQHRKRVAAMAGAHIQRGIIRYLYLLVDLSRVCTFTRNPLLSLSPFAMEFHGWFMFDC